MVAVNGGFFNRVRQLPLGAVRLDSEWLSGPILNRGAIGWDRNGPLMFGTPSVDPGHDRCLDDGGGLSGCSTAVMSSAD
jgi:hypothetical protein